MLGSFLPPFCFFLFSLAPSWALPSFLFPVFLSTHFWSPPVHSPPEIFLSAMNTRLVPNMKKEPGNTLPREAEIHWAKTNLLARTAGTRVTLRVQKQLFIMPPSWLTKAHFPLYQRATAPLRKDSSIHSSVPEGHRVPIPMSSENRRTACRVD